MDNFSVLFNRSETDIINIVEHRIWHSMEEGQFENLPGKGKPLNLNVNPHADPADDTLYRILSKNGCAPEWVELNKEIRSKISEWRSSLKKAWMSRGIGNNSRWIDSSEALKAQMHDINDKVLASSFHLLAHCFDSCFKLFTIGGKLGLCALVLMSLVLRWVLTWLFGVGLCPSTANRIQRSYNLLVLYSNDKCHKM